MLLLEEVTSRTDLTFEVLHFGRGREGEGGVGLHGVGLVLGAQVAEGNVVLVLALLGAEGTRGKAEGAAHLGLDEGRVRVVRVERQGGRDEGFVLQGLLVDERRVGKGGGVFVGRQGACQGGVAIG